MLDDCLQWYERQDEATATSFLLLKRIKDLAYKIRQKLKQTSLRSFIKYNISQVITKYILIKFMILNILHIRTSSGPGV